MDAVSGRSADGLDIDQLGADAELSTLVNAFSMVAKPFRAEETKHKTEVVEPPRDCRPISNLDLTTLSTEISCKQASFTPNLR